MESATQYYVTTLVQAFKNLAPLVLFIIGGYLIFVKLPFWFLRNNMIDQKKKLQGLNNDLALGKGNKINQDDKKNFEQQRVTFEGTSSKREEKRREGKKSPPNRGGEIKSVSPEEVMGFKPNDAFTKLELKKRYLELLKQNHPDRVAFMGQDFKALAEKNTKDINDAYEKLKKRAS
jgi:hypothetical protein